jgi:hypothetical protein
MRVQEACAGAPQYKNKQRQGRIKKLEILRSCRTGTHTQRERKITLQREARFARRGGRGGKVLEDVIELLGRERLGLTRLCGFTRRGRIECITDCRRGTGTKPESNTCCSSWRPAATSTGAPRAKRANASVQASRLRGLSSVPDISFDLRYSFTYAERVNNNERNMRASTQTNSEERGSGRIFIPAHRCFSRSTCTCRPSVSRL